MKILIIADEPKKSELMARLGKGHKIHAYEETEYYDIDGFEGYNAIFDLNLEMHSDAIEEYSQLQETIIVTSGVKTSLAELVYLELIEDELTLIGLNDLPGFINREKAEVSLLDDSDAIKAIAFFKELKWPCIIVKDRVGMVTPRIVLMIINEACYTLQEGTATVADIDESMKLGTNYPYGPFEWCDKIGINEVYETLDALYQDTHDERYKICPLLKSHYLKSETWY
jgi:3-hydroxybutyryl-CoA dehydrogenase